jgi:hypothetical protein
MSQKQGSVLENKSPRKLQEKTSLPRLGNYPKCDIVYLFQPTLANFFVVSSNTRLFQSCSELCQPVEMQSAVISHFPAFSGVSILYELFRLRRDSIYPINV